MAILNNSNAISSGGYDINNSLRFRSSASAYLNRTLSTPTNNKIFTYSVWVKRGALGADYALLSPASTGTGYTTFRFESDNTINFQEFTGATYNYQLDTTQVFRDPSAWYHLVVAVDTTQATAANRIKLYVNGTQITAFATATYPTQNSNPFFNSAVEHRVGANNYITAVQQPFDGYMADINFIDGQALTPSSFGETDTTTGVWKPKAYTGTYGTNGFYLKFSDIATTSGSNAGLGKDFSGNANYWTTNNISVTAGTTYDAMSDVPTLTSATVANYAVISPIAGSTIGTIDNANLRLYYNSGNWSRQISSIGMTTGKYYAEFTITQIGDNSWQVGVTSSIPTRDSSNQNGEISGSSFLNAYQSFSSGASVWDDTSRSSLGFTPVNGDVIGVTFDADTATVKYYRNGSQVGTTGGYVVNTIGSVWYFQMFSKSTDGTGSYGIVDANFGQRPFSYTPPTGFVRLNTYNLPDSTIKKGSTVMDATLYTGTGSSQSIVNVGGFKPDFVWMKTRNVSANSNLVDSVRGVTKLLQSNTTGAEATNTDALSSFNSNGFTVVSDYGSNYAGNTYVGWQWQAGQGSTSSNTSGSITSTVSVNTTAGFSVVTYTGTGANATVGHGLGVAPKMIIVKSRSTAGTDWPVYHASLGATGIVALDTTIAFTVISTPWNNTAPTSSVFTVGTSGDTNLNTRTYVAYCWAEIAGYSKAFSYTGNGSTDGSFVFCGFRPKFVLLKSSSTADDWYIHDSTRNTYNVVDLRLSPNLSSAEVQSAVTVLDFLSNGFKLRTSNGGWNGSGNTYIGIAFAENPFKNALAR